MANKAKPRRERPRREVLSFMTGLCVATGKMKEAEGYLLELLACVAFADWDETVMQLQAS